MPVLRLVASVCILIAAGVLLFVAGFGIYFAISTASDGIGGADEREDLISAVIEASALPAGIAFLIAGTAVWQRTARVFRPLLTGIGLMLVPVVAAGLFEPDQGAFPIGRLLALVLPLALSGLAAAYWLGTLEGRSSTPEVQLSTPVDVPGRKRRIAAFIIALLTTVPLVPLIFLFVALSFNPLEAGDEPNVWGGIAVIVFGIGMVALLVVATLAMVRPQSSMPPFVAVAVWFALSWLILFVGGSGDASEPAGWLAASGTIALPLCLGWLSRVPRD